MTCQRKTIDAIALDVDVEDSRTLGAVDQEEDSRLATQHTHLAQGHDLPGYIGGQCEYDHPHGILATLQDTFECCKINRCLRVSGHVKHAHSALGFQVAKRSHDGVVLEAAREDSVTRLQQPEKADVERFRGVLREDNV